MKTFRVMIPALLELEVESKDADTAIEAVNAAFKRADPLNTPNVRLAVSSSLQPIVRARVLDAVAQGRAYLKGGVG
jgi:hypothetical protein